MNRSSLKFLWQKIKNTFWHLPKNILLSLFYGFPAKKLTLIGVTGTDGKTTTATLIFNTLTQAGLKAGLISTIEAKIGHHSQTTGLHTTSPDPVELQKLFRQMVAQKVTHVVCEVTSHALDQHRFWGCRFQISTITNTSHEHLNYHQNMDNYIKAKAKLFRQSNLAILNKDDPSYKIIKSAISTPIITYSIKRPSLFQAKKIKLDHKNLQFNIGKTILKTDSNYHYQIYNILATMVTIVKLNINQKHLAKIIKKFPEMKGRREKIDNQFNFKTIIDYAHTPAALDQTLSTLKKTTKNQLIVIFGATGGRDPDKRPQMGRVTSQQANIALITADDTRNESVKDINRQIIKGIDSRKYKLIKTPTKITKKQINQIRQSSQKKFVYFNIPQRQDAFNLAIKLAQKGDTVIACGKGHETTILHGKTDYPWSEAEAFRTAFRQK